MRESQTVIEAWRSEGRAEGVAEGMAMGMLEARRADVMRALQLRFQAAPPAELAAAVRGLDDLKRLSRWFDAALTAPSLELFRAMVVAGDAPREHGAARG
jgi:hypothetical protein